MEEKVIQNFEETLLKNNELNLATDRQAFRDATSASYVESEVTRALEQENAYLEELVETNSLLTKKIAIARNCFKCILGITALIVIVRVFAFAQVF